MHWSTVSPLDRFPVRRESRLGGNRIRITKSSKRGRLVGLSVSVSIGLIE